MTDGKEMRDQYNVERVYSLTLTRMAVLLSFLCFFALTKSFKNGKLKGIYKKIIKFSKYCAMKIFRQNFRPKK